MNARERVLVTAAQQGWRVHEDPANAWDATEFRRTHRDRDGQRTEYLRIVYSVSDQVIHVSWAPRLDGIDGRSARRDKLAWTLRKLSE